MTASPRGRKAHGWRSVLVEPGVVHVVPVADVYLHQLDDDCLCGPSTELHQQDGRPDAWVHTHHSLDGREATE